MAMVGSVVTKDMEYNQIYAGSPAKSISDKIGFQFKEVTVEEKLAKMIGYLIEANADNDKIKIVEDISQFKQDGRSYFAVSSRQYLKTGSDEEIRFMKFLLPHRAKFTPVSI
ncbi:MAG: hypothetical protein ACK461_05210, partial [Bacteroidota bacterium]